MTQDKYAKELYGLLTRLKTPVCDPCAGKNAKVPYVNRVADMTAAFGTTPGFTRKTAECSVCGKKTGVTVFA